MTQAPPPTPEQLGPLLRRTIELLNNKLAPDQVRRMASAFRSVRWQFKDADVTVYLLLDADAPAIRFASDLDGDPQMSIETASTTLHDAAWGRTSFGGAFISGKLKVKGLQPLKLTRFVPLLNPFLESYRQAQEEPHGPGW